MLSTIFVFSEEKHEMKKRLYGRLIDNEIFPQNLILTAQPN